jgi:hypothetical protein
VCACVFGKREKEQMSALGSCNSLLGPYERVTARGRGREPKRGEKKNKEESKREESGQGLRV